MSRIDNLIAEHCPDGVEYRPLGEVIENLRTGLNPRQNFKLNTTDARHKYITVRELAGFSLLPTEKTDLIDDEGLARIQARSKLKLGDVLFSGTGTIGRTALVEKVPSTWNIKEGVYALTPKSEVVNPRYLIYTLHSTAVHNRILASADGSTVASVSMSTLRGIRIPVPPLEVQRAIVEILDKFTALEAELEAELEARKKQYAHYRNYLLTPTEDWIATTLGEVAEVFDGPHATPKKTETGPWYLSISSLIDGRFDLSKSAHLSVEDFPKWTRRVEAQSGDTMFSYETRLGQAAFWDQNEPAALGRRMGLLRPQPAKVIPRFLTLLYLGPQFQGLIESKTVSGSTVDRIPIRDMASWPIKIPSLSEQASLVKTVDSFDALVNDLSFGLPAEITARRKQYEYYRDQLLTFKELAS